MHFGMSLVVKLVIVCTLFWYGIWYMVYGIWYMVYGIWYMVYGMVWYTNNECL